MFTRRRWSLSVYASAMFSILITGTSLCAQTLWQGAAYGMSVDEVRKVVPDAVPPRKDPGHLGDGSQELLRLDGIELVNKKFAASFFFKAKKLSQVTLSLQNGRSFDEALGVFDSLTEALRAKYGPEISRKIDRGRLLDTAKATWLLGGTNVSLFLMGVGKDYAVLNVNYQVRLAKEADKL